VIKLRSRGLLLMLVPLAMLASSLGPQTALAWGVPGACTIGFWKNHTDAWAGGLKPTETLTQAGFEVLSVGLANDTLLTALSYAGGPTIPDADRLLLKQAVAALLNSVNPNFDFSLTRNQVLGNTNFALLQVNRDTALKQQALFDQANSGAACPLS
jgi:hypothetical protein